MQFLLMAKFAYNNAKNTSIGHMLFELYCGYYLLVFYKKDLNSPSQSKIVEELCFKL